MKNHLFYSIFVLAILSLTKTHSQELYNQVNAANPNNEGNFVEGWVGFTTNTSVSNEVYKGNYSIKLEAASDGWKRGEYSFTTIPGERYKISIYAKKGSNVAQGFWLWDGFSDFIGKDINGNEWTEYSWVLTASGTSAKLKAYTGNPSVTGNTLYIDNISIAKEDLISPTPPILSSISQTAASVTLSWNGASDNIGVTGYKIYKNDVLEATIGSINSYEAIGLTGGSAYSFTITAIDAYGNESSTSNPILETPGSINTGGVWASMDNNIHYSSGNVGIGTTNPNSLLTIGYTSGTNQLAFKRADGIEYFTINTNASAQAIFTNKTGSGDYNFRTNIGGSGVTSAIFIEGTNGNIGIGTISPDSKLAVNGKIHAQEVKVDMIGWPDYVFAKNYTLPTLEEVEKHIQENGHLPNIPSAKEVEVNGIELGEMNKLLLEKIEELTLYTLEQEKKIKTQNKAYNNLKTRVLKLEKILLRIK